MNDVLGVEEIEKGKKPVSLSMDNADDLFSLTTINEDGTHSLYIFDTPIKYANGSSIDFIDNTIVNAASKDESLVTEKGHLPQKQGYTNKANAFNVSLPENINQGISLPSNVSNCVIGYNRTYNILHYSVMKNGIISSKLNSYELVLQSGADAYFPNTTYNSPAIYFIKPN